MKFLISAFIAATMFALPASAWETLKTSKEVNAEIAGKKLVSTQGRGWLTVRRAGILVGGYKADKLKGSWRMKDGFFCFTATLGKKPSKDCALIQKASNRQIRIIREKGKGRKNIYKVE